LASDRYQEPEKALKEGTLGFKTSTLNTYQAVITENEILIPLRKKKKAKRLLAMMMVSMRRT